MALQKCGRKEQDLSSTSVVRDFWWPNGFTQEVNDDNNIGKSEEKTEEIIQSIIVITKT